MKKTFITVAFFTMTYNTNAQVLSDNDLAATNSAHISAMEQTKAINESVFGSNFVTVGNDTACDYKIGDTKIQDAINAAHKEIRIAQGVYQENVVLFGKFLKLLGGYETCTDAQNNNIGPYHAQIVPITGSNKPSIKITHDSARNQIQMRNLTLKNGEGGGLAIVDADLSLIMENVTITQNTGENGGGISIINSTSDIYAKNLHIFENTADVVGGGLYCSGSNNNIILEREGNPIVGIRSNQARNGGGAYIADGCHFTSYIGGITDIGLAGIGSGINGNMAIQDGGGIYAASGAKVYLNGNQYCAEFNNELFCYGNNTDSVQFLANHADSDENEVGYGGGIYATGIDTAIYANNVLIDKNTARRGGGVYVTDNASFQTQTTFNNGIGGQANGCWKPGRCNLFIGNKASSTTGVGYGGAFYASSGGQLSVSRTHIEYNRANYGAAFHVQDSGSHLSLEGAYITLNGLSSDTTFLDRYPVRILHGASGRIDYSTLADNNAVAASVQNYQSSLEIYSSIIHDQSNAISLVAISPVLSASDCLIVNSFGNINDSTSLEADPKFIDRENNDFHLNATLSPAVDYCDETFAQHTSQDTDREDRGWDDYVATNTYGPFDVGADESYGNDVIFANKFD